MTKPKIAAQLYSVREYCKTEQDVYRTFEHIKAMGFDGVEIEGLQSVVSAQKAALRLQSLNLAVCATRGSLGEVETCPERMIEDALCYNAQECGIGTIKSMYNRSNATIEQYMDIIAPVVEKISEAGLTPSYAVLPHDFMPCADMVTLKASKRPAPGEAWKTYSFYRLMDRFSPGTLNFTLDTLWLVLAGLDVSDSIRQIKGRSNVLRFRDHKIEIGPRSINHPNRTPCEVGGCLLDFASFMPAVCEADIQWITVGQELAARDPFECLQLGLNHVRSLIG